ncbi:redoxin domain-containing protein [Halobaculum sp. EA56]|uniref:redoxin domain-containing protein n=1 Tax=Halobaculum sp. EA56 TaxID=3421648 RepID=UPI003EBB9BCA
MIGRGDTAPTFTLPGADPGGTDEYSLEEYTDRGWTVVLVFYPFDFHPTCTEQVCTVRDADWLTLVEGSAVLGVGGDSVYSHRAYAAEHDVNYPLLADADGSVADAYGLRADVEGHRNVPERAAVVVDEDRTVRFTWRADDPEDTLDVGAVSSAVEALG